MRYGRGQMIIGGQEREIGEGDLVSIPPDEVHGLVAASRNSPIRCFRFAIATPEAGDINDTTH